MRPIALGIENPATTTPCPRIKTAAAVPERFSQSSAKRHGRNTAASIIVFEGLGTLSPINAAKPVIGRNGISLEENVTIEGVCA